MPTKNLTCWLLALLALFPRPGMGIDRYVSLTGGHVAPFTNWTDAATNIQDAIDAASVGDVVWVTNGIYATGGKVMAGDLTNRVALDKALTVQSVNGWAVTTIEGARDSVNFGATAVRGVWMTDGAVLRGFTVRGGQSRSAGDADTLRSGGGIWCSSTNATIVDCVIRDSVSAQFGGGCYRGRLENCLVQGNQSLNGAGVYGSTVLNSALVSNTASGGGSGFGGGAYQSALTNCTVAYNTASAGGGGTVSSFAYNSIIWGNSSPAPIVGTGPGGVPPAYCCLQSPIGANGNISVDPQLKADGIHLAATSPCRNVGNAAFASGMDIDHQPWSGPPSMGCDEWRPEPVAGKPSFAPLHPGGLRFDVFSAGQEPIVYQWLRDGMALTDGPRISGASSATLSVLSLSPEDAGSYQTIVSNAVGVSTSSVARLVIRFVNASSSSPTSPYLNWASAAASIQEAVDASASDDVVVVTNGVYANGGKVMSGDLTNRIALTRAVTVMSVNGPAATIIEGLKDPVTTNGPAAIRATWLAEGARLDGFTIRNGGTRSTGDQTHLRSGGGVWASGTNAVIANCIVVSNTADFGGGAFRGWLDRSTIAGNSAQMDGGGGCSNLITACLINGNRAGANGGGVKEGWVFNSAITRNIAATGGGLYGARARNCAVTFNKATLGVGGIYSTPSATLTNLIVWSNTGGNAPNYNFGPFYNSCSLPLPSGSGNISSDPLLLDDGFHVATNSPCRFAGITPGVGMDIDGQNWTNPPSMGCDQWGPDAVVTGAQLVFDTWGAVRVTATAIGTGPFAFRWLKDGVLLTDGGNLSGVATPNLIIRPVGPGDVAGYQLIASNVLGVVTSSVARLSLRFVDLNSVSALPPYTNWSAAAMNIQDAINVAEPGDLILVTNGIYARGGKAMVGDLTNRVALDKAVTLMSLNGPSATVIQGAWDFAATNGPGSVRGVWMADGAALVGFTVRGGATRGLVGDTINLQTGGGIWCNASSTRIANCIIRGNAAGSGGGGGVYRGALYNCIITENTASSIASGTLYSSLVHCTVAGNWSTFFSVTCVNGFSTNLVLNSIIWGNYDKDGSLANYSGVLLSNSCTRPLPPGTGNISADPLLGSDGLHLQAGSPCLNAGNASFSSGFDLDGQPWSSPPSMGCDERLLQLAVTAPAIVPAGDGKIRLQASVVGATPQNYWWFRNGSLLANDARISGAQSTELAISSFAPADAGYYQLVATNSLGSVTSTVVQVRPHFVDANSQSPNPPYSNWGAAAATIQDAIDVVSDGDLVVVADGTYASGGAVIAGDLTNRVVLNKSVIVSSRNGPTNSIIEGQKDPVGPNGNGNSAVRPVWMNNWTSLAGFTIRNGATRTNGDARMLQSGGGIWGLGGGSTVKGCLITNNSAHQNGGGALGVDLAGCLIAGNTATNGGGVSQGAMDRCYLIENHALNPSGFAGGGGANASLLRNSLIHKNTGAITGGTVLSTLYNCTVTENEGYGLFFGFVYNTISWGNAVGDYTGSLSMNYSCAKFLVANYGTNNLFVDPQLVDPFHLAANSPCRNTGGPLYVSGTDLDGDAWQNPPSMGADQFTGATLTGPLAVSIETQASVLVNRQLRLIGRISGRASRIEWNFGDGPTATNLSYTTTHAWTQPGSYVVTFRAFNDDYPMGVATNVTVEVRTVPAPEWTSIRTYGSFNVSDIYFSTEVGVSNTVEFSTNLVTPIYWLPLGTVVSTNNTMFFRDSAATNEARFYRIQAQ